MNKLYQHSIITLQQAQFGLGRLEQAPDEQYAQPILQEIHQQIIEISENCRRLDVLIQDEPANKQKIFRRRIDQMKFDCNHLSSSLNALHVRLHDKWKRAAERKELLQQRFQQKETALSFDDRELLMNDKMKGANRGINELIAHGTTVLNSLQFQGANLSFMKRRIAGFVQTLGISDTTLRMLERRVSEDWTLFGVGCIAVLIFMYCFYKFWTG